MMAGRGEGGGGDEAPLSNSAPRRRIKKRQKPSKARQKSFGNYSSHCFARVNIEVIRGHQSSNLEKCHISSEMCSYFRNYHR